MLEPRRRILVVSIVALAAALGVSLAVIGRQESSGRADLTARATAFVRVLKGVRRDAEAPGPLDYLRPEDRTDPAVVAGLRRLADVFSNDADADLDVASVEVLGDHHGRTLSPGPGAVRIVKGRPVLSSRQIDWVRGPDGRWYVDPAGL